MKKGFTLIELLAVIVILAIIALIASPIVINIIEESKKSVAEASARNVVSTAKTYYMKKIMETGISLTEIDLSNDILKYDGEQAEKGIIRYDVYGNAYGKMYINQYCVVVALDGTVTSAKTNNINCDITKLDVAKIFSNGEEVYYNPVLNDKCTKVEADSNLSKNNGCMKWYSFLDDGSNKVRLILDHNTTPTIAWVLKGDYIDAGGNETDYGNKGNNNKGALTVNKQLVADISNWDELIKKTARIISAEEIAAITKFQNWDNEWYYLHSNSGSDQYTGAAGTNNYAWLIDNLNGCLDYGCNQDTDVEVYGYWTSTKDSLISHNVWRVFHNGYLSSNTVSNTSVNGIRPVIEVERSIIS